MRDPNQRLADRLDCDLYRIIIRVEDAIPHTRGKEAIAWREARFSLVNARTHIRSMMSDEDREATR